MPTSRISRDRPSAMLQRGVMGTLNSAPGEVSIRSLAIIRATGGDERNVWRNGAAVGNEFAIWKIVARLRPRWRSAEWGS